MATGVERSCAICREVARDIAYVGPCLHQFCRDCIVRWARKNPSCPLCRQAVHTVIYSAPPDQRFVEMAMPQPPVLHSTGPREELGAVGPQPQPQPQPHVAGFPVEMWTLFLRNLSEIQRPLELWLREVLCRACFRDVAFAQGPITATLCHYGLREEALVRELQPFLQEQTVAFVRRLIEVAVSRCCELALHYMDRLPGTAVGQQDTAGATPSTAPSPATSIVQGEPHEEPGLSQAEASGAEASATVASGAQSSGTMALGAEASGAEASATVALGAVASGAESSGTMALGAETSGAEASDAEASGAEAAEPMQTSRCIPRPPWYPARRRIRPSRDASADRRKVWRRQD